MANMEFLNQNDANTTTVINVDSGTATAQFLIDGNTKLQYSTEGYTSDTSSVITFSFASAQVLSQFIIQNHNLKDFRVFYNSATANTFTPDANVTGNSATSTYFSFASVTVSSVTLQMDSAQTADTERLIGQLIATERRLQFDRNPSTDDFDPVIRKKRIIHRMPDGGVTVYNIRDKYRATINLSFIEETFKDELDELYDSGDPVIFVPFPTTTSWDGVAHEVVWTNDFDFKHSDNAKSQGFSGKIRLEETPSV